MDIEWKRYPHIERLDSQEVEGLLLLPEIWVEPKIDGCFEYDTKILLSDGSYKNIGTIVNKNLNVDVLSYDITKKELVPQKIIGKFKYKAEPYDWMTIKVKGIVGDLQSGGGRDKHLRCTKNHKFITSLTPFQETMAKDLKNNDEVFIPQKFPSMVQSQVILGTLLGDGFAYPNNKNIYCNGICFSHSIKQLEYLKFKKTLLGGLWKTGKGYISRYGSIVIRSTTKCNKITQFLYEKVYLNNKKNITKKLLLNLNSLGLAIWYMDDGSLAHSPAQQDRAIFHTSGFLDDEQNIICQYFNDHGYRSSIQNADGYKIIVLDSIGTQNLFSDIGQYIIPSMQYKLSKNFRDRFTPIKDTEKINPSGLIKRKIIEIKPYILPGYKPKSKYKYDLEIENTHLYFANNVLVHNSNASVLRKNGSLNVAKRSQIIGEGDDFRGLKTHIQTNANNFNKFFDKHPNTIVYGEFLIKHTIGFYRPQAFNKFYAFDILDLETNRFLRPDTRVEFLKEFDINLVPPLAKIKGPISGDDHIERLQQMANSNKYLIDETDKVGEGIVIKSFNNDIPYTNKYGRTTWGKIVRQEFKEAHSVEMGVADLSFKEQKEQIFSEIFVTEGRIEKIKQKIMFEKGTRWDSKYIGELLGRVYNDVFTEELWGFVKKEKIVNINFKTLNQMVIIRTKQILGL